MRSNIVDDFVYVVQVLGLRSREGVLQEGGAAFEVALVPAVAEDELFHLVEVALFLETGVEQHRLGNLVATVLPHLSIPQEEEQVAETGFEEELALRRGQAQEGQVVEEEVQFGGVAQTIVQGLEHGLLLDEDLLLAGLIELYLTHLDVVDVLQLGCHQNAGLSGCEDLSLVYLTFLAAQVGIEDLDGLEEGLQFDLGLVGTVLLFLVDVVDEVGQVVEEVLPLLLVPLEHSHLLPQAELVLFSSQSQLVGELLLLRGCLPFPDGLRLALFCLETGFLYQFDGGSSGEGGCLVCREVFVAEGGVEPFDRDPGGETVVALHVGVATLAGHFILLALKSVLGLDGRAVGEGLQFEVVFLAQVDGLEVVDYLQTLKHYQGERRSSHIVPWVTANLVIEEIQQFEYIIRMKLSTSTEWLFFHLWKKSPQTHQSCPGVFVADTVIYRWAQPYFWYYTNKDGQIGRKTKEKVFVEHIEQVFTEGTDPASGISTCYMKSSESTKKTQPQDKIEFEYFDKTQFHNFLYQREKCLNALLQKFVRPKNGRNSMIKIKWTPQFCILYQKTNVHKMGNNKVALNDRLITFEGAESLTHSESITSPILATDLEYICLNIVKHIQEVSGGNIQISQMVLYFKVDHANKLWLLFCSGIKIREKYQIREQTVSLGKGAPRAQSPVLSIRNPRLDAQNKHSLNTHQIPVGTDVCVSCSRVDKMYSLQYKHIVESFEAGLADNDPAQMLRDYQAEPRKHQDLVDRMGFPLEFLENEEDAPPSPNQPYVLTQVHGKISDSKYLVLKENPSWLQQRLRVCSECFLKYTQVTLHNEESQHLQKVVHQAERTLQDKVAHRTPLLGKPTLAGLKDKLSELQQQHPGLLESKVTALPCNPKYSHVQSKYMEDAPSRQALSAKYLSYQSSAKPLTCESRQRPTYQPSQVVEEEEEVMVAPRQVVSVQQGRRKGKYQPDSIYHPESSKQLIQRQKGGLPRINASTCSNSTTASSRRIDHSSTIGILQELKSQLRDL